MLIRYGRAFLFQSVKFWWKFVLEYFQDQRQQTDQKGVKNISIKNEFVRIRMISKMNSQQVEEHLISSSVAQTRVYIIPFQYVLTHLSNLTQTCPSTRGKHLRVCYFVQVDTLDQVLKLEDRIQKIEGVKELHVSVIPFENREEMREEIKMMYKMNESQFEDQYLQMLELLETQTEGKVIKQFCMKQLGWSLAKTEKILEMEKIERIEKFVKYRGFNKLEEMQVGTVWSFIEGWLGGEVEKC